MASSGKTGSIGADGSTPATRIDKYALVTSPSQSNNYGRITARDIVLSMLIDDGVSTRDNRYNILNPNHLFIGKYSRDHSSEGHQSCIVYTVTYQDNIDESKVSLTEAQYRTIDDDLFTELNKLR